MTRPINVELSKETKQVIYAMAGAADLAISSVRNFPTEIEKLVERVPEEAERLRTVLPAEAVRAYAGLIERGEAVVRGLLDTRPWRPSGSGPRHRTHTRVTRVRVTSAGGQEPATAERPEAAGGPARAASRSRGSGRGHAPRGERAEPDAINHALGETGLHATDEPLPQAADETEPAGDG